MIALHPIVKQVVCVVIVALLDQGFVANAARQPLIKTLKQLEEEG